MALMASITESNSLTGKASSQFRKEGSTLLSKGTDVFRNILVNSETGEVKGINEDRVKDNEALNITERLKNLKSGIKEFVTEEKADLKKYFQEAAEKTGVPERLLEAVAKQESGFKETAVSSSGAMGIMQLMPETAENLGVKDPFNAEENILGGAKYLAENLKRFNGNLEKTLAAYNAGPGKVEEYDGVPPYKETINYVANIMKDLGEDFSQKVNSSSGNTGNLFNGSIGNLFSSNFRNLLSENSGSILSENLENIFDGDLDKETLSNLLEIMRLKMLLNVTQIGETEN